jgi:outer membrane protein assembly factor BamB
MKQTAFLSLLLCCCCIVRPQQVFFTSSQEFGKEDLKLFYSSIALQDSSLLFNANDYRLYAYDRNSTRLKWEYTLGRKSDVPPFFADSLIWARARDNEMMQLDRTTGQEKGSLALYTVETQPVIKNGIAYGTGIYDSGGCLFAYDMKAGTVLWQRFLAHGCSVTPYYLPGRIMANAEGNNWLEVGYDGKLIQAGCDNLEVGYPSELPCARKFVTLTHDQKEIPEEFLQKVFSTEYLSFYTTTQYTFIAGEGKLLILGDKLKKRTIIQFSALSGSPEIYDDAPATILQADDKTVWVLTAGRLIGYDYKNKKPVKTTDLSRWQPHQVLIDGEKLWLISEKDGLLYGLTW